MSKSIWQKLGITEAETSATIPAPAVAAPSATHVPVYQVMPTTSAINADLMAALMVNINKAVQPNNLMALTEMAETLKSAIVDEGTRIKAASAALKLSFFDISASVDGLIACANSEKNNFLANDVAGMDSAIALKTDALNGILGRIEDTIKKLNDLTFERDNLTAEVNLDQQNRNNTVSTFEATASKIVSIFEEERKRIQIFLPQGVA